MPTIRIPSYMKPNYRVRINNTPYEYPAGTVQDVPQPVYDAIMHYYESHPEENPPETTEEMIIRICSKMIEESTPEIKRYDIDLSGVALSSSPATITDACPASTISDICESDDPVPVRLIFEYDSTMYEVDAYHVVDVEEICFVVPHVTDYEVDGFINVVLFLLNKTPKARLVYTELSGGGE